MTRLQFFFFNVCVIMEEWGRQKRTLDPLELELQAVMSPYVGVEPISASHNQEDAHLF